MIRKKLFLTSALALGIVSSLTGCSTVDGKTDTTFQTTDAAFPSWNSPDPSAYTWTLPDTSHWWNFGKNVSQDVLSFIANTMLDLVAWIMHIAILVSSKFSDPTWITDPVTSKVATVFKSGYEDIFMKFLPVLVMITVGYLAWKYVVAHHAKMLTGIISTVLASGLIAFFFFDFGDAFKWIDGAGNLVTNTASSAVASAAGTPVGSEYDTLWNNYILYPWEYGQFGQISGNISDFNVNVSAMQQNGEDITWHPDPTPGNQSPAQIDLKNGDNWVKLFLQNTSQQSRHDLEADLTKCANDNVSPFTGAKLSAAALSNANPYAMIPFLFIELLLIITPVVFLCYVGFQLFVRELLFIVTIMMGLVTVPMAFVPEIGWRITFNWIREAVGHQVERVSNAIYAALLFSVAGIITTSVGNSEAEMMLAFLIDAILFAAAIMYRQKVFSVAVHPLSDAARGVDTHHRMTMDEWAQHNHENEERMRHGLKPRGHVALEHHEGGHLRDNFEHGAEHAAEHAAAAHISGGRHIPLGEHGGHEAEQGATGIRGRLSSLASNFKETAGARLQDHWNEIRNPGRPLTHAERIRNREQMWRGMERKVHGHALQGLKHGHLMPMHVTRMGLKGHRAVVKMPSNMRQMIQDAHARFAGERMNPTLADNFSTPAPVDQQVNQQPVANPYEGSRVTWSNETYADVANRMVVDESALTEEARMQRQQELNSAFSEMGDSNYQPMSRDEFLARTNGGQPEAVERMRQEDAYGAMFTQMDNPNFRPMPRDEALRGVQPSMADGYTAPASDPVRVDESNRVNSNTTRVAPSRETPARQTDESARRVAVNRNAGNGGGSRPVDESTNRTNGGSGSGRAVDESATRTQQSTTAAHQDESNVIPVSRQEFRTHADAEPHLQFGDANVTDINRARAEQAAAETAAPRATQQSQGSSQGQSQGNRAQRRAAQRQERQQTRRRAQAGGRRAVNRNERPHAYDEQSNSAANDDFDGDSM